jgi:hypothetical protein
MGLAMAETDLDVAIVGGGVSGVYSGWRLLNCPDLVDSLAELADRRPQKRLRVGLFEYSDRIGGRLLSKLLPGAPNLPVELGGMRFLNSHLRVWNLVHRFNLATTELKVDDPNGRNLYYLRGQHFRAADWSRPDFVPPYKLNEGETARSPGQLLGEIALRYQSRAEEFRDVGFWNLLQRELSREAFSLVREAVGYDTLVNNWNAAEAIPFLLADFPADAKYFKLKQGFQSLPLTLAKQFEMAGGEIHHSHRLHRIDWNKSTQQVELLFDKSGGSNRFVIPRAPSENDELRVRASHTILAMPRRSIELLHPDSFIFNSAEFQTNLRTVLPQPAFKIFAAYREPWWTNSREITAGRSLTDLPVRQCYYWGPEIDSARMTELQERGKRIVENSILMASYSDGNSVEFWSGLAHHVDRYSPPPFACPPGVGITPFVQDLSASAPLVEELQRQLRSLHGLNQIEAPNQGAQLLPPYAVVYRDWTEEPFGGGWHFWKIGVDSQSVMRFMRKPFREATSDLPSAPLYICGEAWSRQQGWVEGALATADDVLENELRLSPLN